MSILELRPDQFNQKSIKELSELGSPSDQKIEIELPKTDSLTIDSIKDRIREGNHTVLAEQTYYSSPKNALIWYDAFENYRRSKGNFDTTSRIKFYQAGEYSNREVTARVVISNPTVELEDGTEYENVYCVHIGMSSGVYDEVMIIKKE